MGSVAAVISLSSSQSWARLGGGGGFSSPGGGSGGGSDDIAGALVEFLAEVGIEVLLNLAQALIELTIEHPKVGIPIDLGLIGIAVLITRSRSKTSNRSTLSMGSLKSPDRALVRSSTLSSQIQQVRKLDPGFSIVLLEDFLNLLFHQFHTHANSKNPSALQHYFAPDLLGQVPNQTAPTQPLTPTQASTPTTADEIIIGAMVIERITAHSSKGYEAAVSFEANYRQNGQELYVVEKWNLFRSPGAKTKPPKNIRQLSCPACGASGECDERGACKSCQQVNRNGEFDWLVTRISHSETAKPPAIDGGDVEVGTNLPSLVDPDFEKNSTLVDLNSVIVKINQIFLQLQEAWSSQKWQKARPFETDALFESHLYWINNYKKQNLRNVIEQITVEKFKPVKVTVDLHYQSVTVRVYARMLDYTINQSTKNIVSGNATKVRQFSEYWTLIRSNHFKPPVKESATCCPACGAELNISMAGTCTYCQSRIVSGEFDWVLSKIEQDEVYVG